MKAHALCDLIDRLAIGDVITLRANLGYDRFVHKHGESVRYSDNDEYTFTICRLEPEIYRLSGIHATFLFSNWFAQGEFQLGLQFWTNNMCHYIEANKIKEVKIDSKAKEWSRSTFGEVKK